MRDGGGAQQKLLANANTESLAFMNDWGKFVLGVFKVNIMEGK